jgi:general secretion pathway protein G
MWARYPSSQRTWRAHSGRYRPGGLTLLEVLVVITILAVLASLLAVNYRGTLTSAKHKIAKQELARLKDVLEQYYLEAGTYPDQSEGLAALNRPLPGRSEPLVDDAIRDPWGRPYVYVFPGNHGKYDLASLGADGVEGGEDENADIVSWAREDAGDAVSGG